MKHNIKISIIIIFIVVFIGILRFSENTDDLGTYNTGWDGSNQIKNELSGNHSVISIPDIMDLTAYDSSKTALVIFAPDTIFSKNDTQIIKQFIEKGGLLILADDFHRGNALLSNLTGEIAFSNMLLLDDKNYWKNFTFPIATTSITDIGNITMNYPTSLIVRNSSVDILASSSRFSWLSADNTERGMGRGAGVSYPVIARTILGRGQIIAVADPSIFINSMLSMSDNKYLLGKLTESRKNIIFYESSRIPPVPVFHYQIKTNYYIQFLFAATILILLVLYINREKLFFQTHNNPAPHNHISEEDEKEIISEIIQRNKWENRKVQHFKNKLEGRK